MSSTTPHSSPNLDSLGRSASFMKWVRIGAGFAIFFAAAFAWLWLTTLTNRLRIYFMRDSYQVERLVVTGVVVPRNRMSPPTRWLTGTVAGRPERVRPRLPPHLKSTKTEDVLATFPIGSTVPVLYDPDATEMTIQGESVRVLHFTPDFWQRERRLRHKLLCYVLLPLPLTIAFYRYVRHRAYIIPHLLPRS